LSVDRLACAAHLLRNWSSGMAITEQLDLQLTIGIDTHADIHVAVALDQFGRRLDTCTIPTTSAGFTALLDWSKQFGSVERIGMEATGSYGAGLARWLRSRGFAVFEVERPKPSCGAVEASRIQSMRRLLPEPSRPARLLASRRPALGRSR
jgi:hypothetical protein